MKRKLVLVLCMSVMIAACQKSSQDVTPSISMTSTDQNTTPNPDMNTGAHSDENVAARYSIDWNQYPECGNGSKFISPIEANAMIASYLYSIHCDKNEDDVRSYSVDADMLRAYLADPEVKNVKLFFAHTANYIKSGHLGKPAGYKSEALTIIIAGYNGKGDYVYHNGKVLDHMNPCPFACPPGKAASSFLY